MGKIDWLLPGVPVGIIFYIRVLVEREFIMQQKIYQKTWFIIVMLIFFFPVGLFLMWKCSDWNKIVKIIISVLCVLALIGVWGNDTNESDPSLPSSVQSEDEPSSANQPIDAGTKSEVEPESKETPQPSDTTTIGQKNALKKAHDYLEYTAFSYSGLIEQLEFEGFLTDEATYAANNCGADWGEQAALKAKQYLEYSSFSRSGLIEQLEYEGFTSDQAGYGATAVGY